MKIKYIISIVAAFSLGLYSCMPDMELENPNAVTTGSYYKTTDELIAAVNGAYNMLQRNGGWGRYMFYTTNARGDDWDFTYKASNGMKEVPPLCNYTYSSSNLAINECWDDMNIMVYAANIVLTKAPDAEATDSMKNRIMGEAYFLRGLAFYYLGQLFGEEIPVKTTLPQSVDDYFAPSAEPGVLYEQMIADFKMAVELLPVRSVMYAKDADIGRATKGSALGFLAKAYMNRPIFDNYRSGAQSEWQLAADAIEQIFKSNEYELMEVFRYNHTEEFENNIESLFEVQFFDGEGSFNSAVGEDFIESWGSSDQSTWRQQEIGQKDGGDNSNWWNMMPVKKTYEEFEKDQFGDYIDPRVYQTLWCPSGAWYQLTSGRWVPFYKMFEPLGRIDPNYGEWFGCRKYCGDLATPDWETGINDRILRYSDILLMYAECLVELDKETEAYEYVNMVRSRANNMVPAIESNAHLFYTEEPGSLPTVQDLIANAPTINGIEINTMRRAIKHERFVELFGEGTRFIDLLRWSYNDNDPDRSTVMEVVRTKGSGFIDGVHEYFPIPSAEITTNPNIKPNRAN